MFLLGLLCGPGTAYAHADLELRIAELTKSIEKTPGESELYLRRGELHRKHADWEAALADFDRAEVRGAPKVDLRYLRGRLYFESGSDKEAMSQLTHFLIDRPDHAHARIMRALLLGRLEMDPEAARHYELGMRNLVAPTPENFIQLAELYMAAGLDNLDQALGSLDRGIERLGPVITLVKFASDLEFDAGRYQDALKRLDLLPDALAGTPHWLARKGEILMAAGDRESALAAYRLCLERITALPAGRRLAPAILELRRKAQSVLEGT